MKRLVIVCEGGFGNRFNALISGLYFANRYGYNPFVLWPKTYVCGASFNDLYEPALGHTDDKLYLSGTLCAVACHGFTPWWGNQKPWWKTNKPIFDIKSSFSLDTLHKFFLKTGCDDCIYFNDSIPKCISPSQLMEPLKLLNFRSYLRNAANQFISDSFRGEEFFGLHLRLTDSTQHRGRLLAEAIEQANNLKDKKVFVCSDDEIAEQQLSQLGNVRTFPKKRYVEKLVSNKPWVWKADGGWLEYNVVRSAESVKEAIIDLIILSESYIISNNGSSFLQTAKILELRRELEMTSTAPLTAPLEQRPFWHLVIQMTFNRLRRWLLLSNKPWAWRAFHWNRFGYLRSPRWTLVRSIGHTCSAAIRGNEQRRR